MSVGDSVVESVKVWVGLGRKVLALARARMIILLRVFGYFLF